MSQLAELLKQREALDAEIKALQRAEKQAALSQIRELVRLYDIDIVAEFASDSAKATPARRYSVKVKYRDPATGKTWTGRGLQPNWLKHHLASGKALDEFLVQDTPISTSLAS